MKRSYKVKRGAIIFAILMIGLVLIGCGVPQDVQNELSQLRTEKANSEKERANLGQQVEQLNKTIQELKTAATKCPKNPTYDELINFLKDDTTDKLWTTYQDHMVLGNMLIVNALRKGIGPGFRVAIDIKAGQTWGFVGFDTRDRGVVYILTPLDKVVKLEVGKNYAELNGFSSAEIGNVDSTILAIREVR
jgi:hypothetical protein